MDINKSQLFSAADAFLKTIDDSFWEEHGIDYEETVTGLASALKTLGVRITEDVRAYELDSMEERYYNGGYCPHVQGDYRPEFFRYECWWIIKPEELGGNPLPPLDERFCAKCRSQYEEVRIHAD